MEFMIADVQRSQGSAEAKFVRTMAFPEGEGSHTKIAVPDEIEDKGLKIGSPEPEPGVRVGSPEPEPGVRVANPQDQGKKVARPSIASTNGDFRRPIQLSGPKGKSDGLVDLKLNRSSLHPMMGVRKRRR